MRSYCCILVFATAACAADLSDELDDADSGDDEAGGAKVEHEPDGDATRTTVDATDEALWVYLDFESKAQVEVDDPLTSDAWDVGFLRYSIAINGGVSGNAGMEAVVLENTELDAVTTVPDGPWVTDQLDGDDFDDDPDYVTAKWYDYDFATHVLTPVPTVYVVRSVEGNYLALQVVGYYDDAGTSGWMQLRWKPLE